MYAQEPLVCMVSTVLSDRARACMMPRPGCPSPCHGNGVGVMVGVTVGVVEVAVGVVVAPPPV